MTNLIINRVNYLLSDQYPNLYLSKNDDFVFRIQYCHLKLHLSGQYTNESFLIWSKDLKDEDYIYYSFSIPQKNEYFTIESGNYPFYKFKYKFIREQLIEFFKERNFIVEPIPIGCDLKIYEKVDDFNNEWSIYRRFDFSINNGKNQEIAFNIGSENTLISNQFQHFESTDKISFIDTKDNFIKRLGGRDDINNCRIIANKENTKIKLQEFIRSINCVLQ